MEQQQKLGKYTVVRRLGAGGMAEVYLCRLHGIGGFEKQVVIKRIRTDIANDSEFVTMFFDEARLAANLSHPNVIQVFEVDELDGAPYIAMEYVKGPTLSSLLQCLRKLGADHVARTPAELGHLALIFAGACAGLEHAHNAEDASGRPLKIVHRDISPQNIIVSLDGTAKIFDFGVAKARGSLALTGTDRVKGKFAYMAPEQLRAQPVDSRADVFALGVCLYEATVGRRPFVGGSEAELYAARLDGNFRRPSELVEGFPDELEQIILATMSADPEGRPSAGELKDRLLAFASSGRHASTTKDVAAWMRELFPDDASDAYDSYSSSPSLTPLPKSTKVPAVNAVEPGRGKRLAWTVVGGGAVALAAIAIAVVILGKSVDDPERGVEPSASAPPPPSAPPPSSAPTPPSAPQPPSAPPPPVELVVGAATVNPADAERIVRDASRQQDASKVDVTVTKKVARLDPKRPPMRDAQKVPAASIKAGAPASTATKVDPGKPGHADQISTSQGSAPAPAPEPIKATTPVAPVPPAPAPVTKPVPPPVPAPVKSIGSLDAIPSTHLTGLDGSLPRSEVDAAIGRVSSAFRDCYRGAAQRKQATPALKITVRFDIDEQSTARGVRVAGDTLGVSDCITAAFSKIRTRTAPDVGTVSVTAVVTFKPVKP
jgi:serine/threonine-protein kinase